MIKFAAINLLWLFLTLPCNAQKNTGRESVVNIMFELSGRRGITQLSITPALAISTSKTEKKYITISPEKWSELLSTIKELDLSSINQLKAPTQKRLVDAAFHCRIFISTKNKKYQTGYFDSGIPMMELKPLYDKIEAIRNAINYDGEFWKPE